MRGLARTLALGVLLGTLLSAPLAAGEVPGPLAHAHLPRAVVSGPFGTAGSIAPAPAASSPVPRGLGDVARAGPHASFSSPLVLSTGSTNGNMNGGPPNAPTPAASVVDDSQGRPNVAFASNVSGSWEIYYTLGTASGSSFSTPTLVSGAPSAGMEYTSPTLSINSGDTAICISFLRTAVSSSNLGVGDYEESCSTDGGSSWNGPYTDRGYSANVCEWGTLYDPVGAFDPSGNFVIGYLCKLYSNATLTLGWDVFDSPTANVSSSSALPIAGYPGSMHYTVELSFACGGSSSGCATAYSITDTTDTDWHLLVVSSTSDFSKGSVFGPVQVASVPVPSGNRIGLEVFQGGLAYASNGTLSGLTYLELSVGSTTLKNVEFAYSTNGWQSPGAITVDPTPPAGPTGSGLLGPTLSMEGSGGAPFLTWENSSGTVVYAAAAPAPGGAWSSVQSLGTSGGWPVDATTTVGAGGVWRWDIVFDTSGGSPEIDYTQLLGPSLGSLLSDHPAGETGHLVNFTATGAAGGFSPYTYSWSAAPASGLGCVASTSLQQGCVPTTVGTYAVSVQAVDSAGFSSPAATLASFTVVAGLAAATPVGWPNAALGDVGESVFLNTTLTGGLSPYVVSWSGLPAGCTASSTVSVACTLAGPVGSAGVAARANDAYNYNATSPALAYTVDAPPSISSVSGSPNPGQPQVSVTFSASVTGGAAPLSYAWSFGHGSISSAPSPTFTFPSSGSYPVWLNVTDAAGVTARASMTESVVPSLGVTATSAPATPTAQQEVFLNATTSGGVPSYTYAWNFGDGTHGTGTHATHAYATPGTFTATVFVNDSAGDMASAQVTLSVSAVSNGLKVTTATGTPNPANTTTPVAFSVGASGGVTPYTFQWNFGDGSSLGFGSSISHLYTTPSTGSGFLVNATVTDAAGQSDSQTFYERVTLGTGAPPLVVGSLSANPNPGEVDLPVTFSISTQGGTAPLSYSWLYGDGASFTGPDPVQDHNFTTAGSYTTEVRVQDAHGKVGFANATITILSAVVAVLSETPSSGTTPLQVHLEASATGGDSPYVYRFSLGDLLVPSQPNGSFDHTFVASGTYEIVMVVTDSLGGSSRAYANVSVASGSGGGGGGGGSGSGSPFPAPSLSWLSQPWLYLVLIAVLVAAIAIALRPRRRGPGGAAGPEAATGVALDPDAQAPSAFPPPGAISDDNAEDGSPTRIPESYPMLPQRTEDLLPSAEPSPTAAVAPVATEVPRAPSSTSPPSPASSLTTSPPPQVGSPEPAAGAPPGSVAEASRIPLLAATPALSELDNREPLTPPTAPPPDSPPPEGSPPSSATPPSRPSSASNCAICGMPLQDGSCSFCGMTW